MYDKIKQLLQLLINSKSYMFLFVLFLVGCNLRTWDTHRVECLENHPNEECSYELCLYQRSIGYNDDTKYQIKIQYLECQLNAKNTVNDQLICAK